MTERLTMKTKIFYGIADLGISLLTASIQFFLLFFLHGYSRHQPRFGRNRFAGGQTHLGCH